MAKLSDAAQLDVANKLALGIASSNADKSYFEENFPWLPTVLASDIWTDNVPYAATPTEADDISAGLTTDAATNPIVEKLTMAVMDEIPLSNGQGWSLYEVPGVATPATRVIDWLNPQSFGPGYFLSIFENDNTPITLTDGRYQVDSRNGIVRFDEGFTPSDLGLLTPLKITVYRYNGDKGVFAGGSNVSNVPHQQELIPQAIGPTDGDVILTDMLDFAVTNPESVRLYHNKLIQVQGLDRDYSLTGPDFKQIIWQPQGGGLGTAQSLEATDELVAHFLQDADSAFGPTGPAGPDGPVGPDGVAGPAGGIGPAGAQGLTGPAGATGAPASLAEVLAVGNTTGTGTGGNDVIISDGDLIRFEIDNQDDIGVDGTTLGGRPRKIFVGTEVVVGNTVVIGTNYINSSESLTITPSGTGAVTIVGDLDVTGLINGGSIGGGSHNLLNVGDATAAVSTGDFSCKEGIEDYDRELFYDVSSGIFYIGAGASSPFPITGSIRATNGNANTVNGSNLSIAAGDAGGALSDGGSLFLRGGFGSYGGVGSIILRGGEQDDLFGLKPGADIDIKGGDGAVPAGPGGNVNIDGGGGSFNPGGYVQITGGPASTGEAAGHVWVEGGPGDDSSGGSVNILGGVVTGTGNGGAVSIGARAGAGGGLGGLVLIRSGNTGGVNADGGNIWIETGNGGSGSGEGGTLKLQCGTGGTDGVIDFHTGGSIRWTIDGSGDLIAASGGVIRAAAGVLTLGSSGFTTDFPSGSTVDFTGATVTGLGDITSPWGSWGALDGVATATNYATITARNGHRLLEFAGSTNDESAVFGDTGGGVMSPNYGGGTLTVKLYWLSFDQTSGNVVWNVSWERHADDSGTDAFDLDADGFAAVQAVTDTTASVNGELSVATIAFTQAQADGIAASESFRLKVTRNQASGSDTMTGDAQLLRVTYEE